MRVGENERSDRSPGDRYRELRRILHLAAEAPDERREDVLRAECGGDDDLLAEVRSLLDAPAVDTTEIFDAGRLEPGRLEPGRLEPGRPAPPPAEIGPFRIRREVGRGGMGIVYEAVDGRSGRVVAVKDVYPHLLSSERILRRFEREAAAGRRIDHPNVVRTLDYVRVPTDGGTRDLLVTEYVEGRTLRDLGAAFGPLSEAMLRELARQVAAGLASIHAAGVVHRDLKPENILVTDDQRVRIMDLGVARLHEASVALTREGEFVGTFLYAAPEQCRGEEIGPAADQYALGVLLHELATGENPFDRPTAAAVFSAHLESVPPPLDELDGDLSPFFAELVSVLLAKRPEARFASTDELLAVLSEGEASDWWRRTAPARRRSSVRRPALPVARAVPLRGRDDVMDTLRRAWREAKEGRGATVLLEGEAGLGKTRIADAFLSEVSGGSQALVGSFSPSAGVCGVTAAIIDRFGDRLEEELSRRLDASPESAAAFARLTRGEAAESHREAFVYHCGNLLRSFAEEGPVVWVADDAHHATAAARAALASLARAASESRALLLLTARPPAADEAGGLAAELSRTERFHRIPLPRLDEAEVERLLAAAFESEVTARELASPIAARSEGVPFFVLSMIDALREQGYVRRTDSGEWVVARSVKELALPDATRDLLAARAAGLAREEREILEVAAVAGVDFDAEIVASVIGRPLVSVLRALAELTRRTGLVRAHGRRFRFDHALLADYFHGSLPELLRDEYHGLLADAIRAAGGEIDGAKAALLTRHYLLSRRPEEALPFLLDGLDHLSGLYRYEDFLRAAEGALARPDLLANELRAEVLLRTSPVLHAAGRTGESRAAAIEAKRIGEAIGDLRIRGQGHMHVGVADSNQGRQRESVGRFRAASRLARAAGDARLEAGAMTNHAVSMIRIGTTEEAASLLAEARKAAQSVGDENTELLAAVNLATLDHRSGRVARAREEYLEALAIARRLGRRPVESYTESSLGLLAFNTGEFEEARTRLERALALGAETGNRPAYRGALAHLAVVEHAQGHYLRALRFQERLLTLRREAGERAGESTSLAALGEGKLWLGNVEEARRDLQAALVIAEQVDDPLYAGDGYLALAEVEWNAGDRDAALRAATRARELLGDATETGGAVGSALFFARLAAEDGRFDEARAELEGVRRLAEEGGQAGLYLVLSAQLAALPGGDPAALEGRLSDLEARAPHHHRTEARFLLWRATGDLAHLTEARRLAREARDRAGDPHRKAMAGNLRLHREIEAAWRDR